MADLWREQRQRARASAAPLALRMRPRSLEEYVGQKRILGQGMLLRRMIEADALTSIILHGPPGTGKTALAEVIASATGRAFIRENAASVGVKRIREIIDEADARLVESRRRTILFLDEIHRFNKAQQDALLSDVERGVITLIGATTENPLFTVNSALVSRSTLFRLEPLTEDEIIEILRRALADADRGVGSLSVRADDEALSLWARQSDGDARRALNALEIAALSLAREAGAGLPSPLGREGGERSEPAEGRLRITLDIARESMQGKASLYSPHGDEHYDAASAMIKSVRGCDPDAAVYWIARMLEGGEDPEFIARRLAILASEDIGNADPRAIMVADAAWSLVARVGMPEARITLAQCATYLALAPKSNAAYLAIDAAIADVREGRTLPVPKILRDARSASGRILSEKEQRQWAKRDAVSAGQPAPPGGKGGSRSEPGEGAPANRAGASRAARESRPTGKGEAYIYAHDAPANTSIGGVTGQDYLGVDKRYYHPSDRGFEQTLRERLREILEAQRREEPAPER